jgi:phosphoglycerol transferase MdoB-like AlkP superfamily enzyme
MPKTPATNPIPPEHAAPAGLRGFVRTRLAGRFGGLYFLGAVVLAAGFLLRTALLIQSVPAAGFSVGDVARIYCLGLFYDVISYLTMIAPVAVFVTFMPDRLFRSRVNRAVITGFYFLVVFITLFDIAAEWLFWYEFTSRFNFISVDYLVYSHELVGNIAESYPAKTIIACILAGTLAVVLLTRRYVLMGSRSTSTLTGRLKRGAVFLGVPLLAWGFVSNSLAETSGNRYVTELSKNGMYSFAAAFSANKIDYAHFYQTRDTDEAFTRLRQTLAGPGSRFVGPGPRDIARTVTAPGPAKRLNVILVTVESLSAEFLGVFGSHDGLTPNLDALAAEGLLFTRLYATGNRTVRGLEALAVSVPPTPGSSVVKRPDQSRLFSLPGLLRRDGYDTAFLYGGFGYFDNMSDFFSTNGCRVVDRSAMGAGEISFATIWGVCDEDLYRRALKEADAAHADGRPFFQFVMTTSNHRPFCYPQKIDIPSGSGRHGAVKYTDYALGQFLRQARTKPWFGQTIFLIVADHCANSAGKSEVPVDRYHIPALFYAPKIVPPGRCDELCSQVDLGPTLLGMLQVSYVSKFYGRDVLRDPPRRALLGTYQKLGLLTADGVLTVLAPGGGHEGFRVAPDGTQDPVDIDQGHVLDAVSYYQTADYLLRNHLQSQD